MCSQANEYTDLDFGGGETVGGSNGTGGAWEWRRLKRSIAPVLEGDANTGASASVGVINIALQCGGCTPPSEGCEVDVDKLIFTIDAEMRPISTDGAGS